MSLPTGLRLVHRTFTSKVQLRQAKGTQARPLATVESITGAGIGNDPPSGPSSLLRTASFNGVICTIVPIVALRGDIVLQAANAPEPELVPLYCLESLPLAAWNGRPIVPLHPNDGEQYISANDPETLDKWGFGLTFNAELSVADKALQLDGYLNPSRAAVVGPLANDVLARLATDELIEVSVGVSVLVSDIGGKLISADGSSTAYSATWEQLLYVDHVAMLPKGVEGACSVDVGGCGAPRVGGSSASMGNNNATITSGGSNMAEIAETTVVPVVEVATSPPEIWHSNLNELLETALYDYFKSQLDSQPPLPGVEPDTDDLYIWIQDFSNLRVVYERGAGPSYQQYYSLDPNGKVILKGNEVEVIREKDYRPASKAPAKGFIGKIRDMLRSLAGARHSTKDQAMVQTIHDQARELGASCPPGDEKQEGEEGGMKPMEAAPQVGSAPQANQPAAAPYSCKGGEKLMASLTKDQKAALVTKILSAGATFNESQREVLLTTDEAVLQVLAGATSIDPDGGKAKEVVVAQAPAQPATQTPAAQAPARALSADEWWAQAPPELADVRALANRAKEAERQEMDTLVKALATRQESFTEDQLKAMDLTNLRSLASLTGLFLPRFDYTGAMGSITRDAASTQQDKETQVYHNPPKPFDLMRANKNASSGKLVSDAVRTEAN